ncbi:syndecan-4-like [Perognathus longimembris pacificus]|uniref:syndecan-4-like n=1 Tax=Perognathus longimembris pacificus TaxID=214514 RepID=UPI002018D7E3|nr:syndecan-4-like [Perognathus longimembris pacificus]
MAPARPLAPLLLLLLCVGLPAAVAESIRETEVIDPQDVLEGGYFSGDLPDDEDIGGPGQDSDDFELSGSGAMDDSEDHRTFPEVIHPLVPLNNHIPEREGPGRWVPTEIGELEENEVIPKRIAPFGDEDVSNRVSMSSTAQGSNIFARTEVLAALIVGGVVGILFAVFLILLLVYRMKKKDEGSYDLGKKPIYKKAPTNEFYA